VIRLHSPVGWNAHHCVSTVGASTNVGRVFRAWYAHNDAWMTESDRGKLNIITELLSIKGTLLSKLTLDFFCWPKSMYFRKIFTMKTISIDAVVTEILKAEM